MAEWLDRSYRHLGKYFDVSTIKEYYDSIKGIAGNLFHIHSMYSINDSTMTTDEICARAVELGSRNVTLSDHGTLLGFSSFMKSGEKYGINTVPGVETYREDRRHMCLYPRNHKGFVDISYAMREANTNIEVKKVKTSTLKYPIMTKEMCEEFFKGNEDVICTSACINGSIAHILLKNKKLLDTINKEKNKIAQYKEGYEIYNNTKKKQEELKENLKKIKATCKQYESYLKDSYLKKINTLEKKISEASNQMQQQVLFEDIEDTNITKLAALKSDYNQAKENREIAQRDLPDLQRMVKCITSDIEECKKLLDEHKGDNTSYSKGILKIGNIVLYDNDELYKEALEDARWYKETFPLFFIELQNHGLEDEAFVMPLLVKVARELDIPLIAANDAHMKDGSDDSIEARRLVRYNYFSKAQTVSDADKEMYIKSDEELASALKEVVDNDAVFEAIFNTRILTTCKVVFPKESHYPTVNSDVSLEELIEKGIKRCLESHIIEEWTDEYQERLKYELKIMTDMGYIDYHKVVEDFCREGRFLGRIPESEIKNAPSDYSKMHEWVEANNFPVNGVGIGAGRGSAVGSLVCCVLGITNVDPIKYNLLFERFLNPERVSMPDIDTDIATRIRPLLIKYLKWKYGEKAVCSIATEGTYAAKKAIQMAGRDRSSQLYDEYPTNEARNLKSAYTRNYTSKLSDAIPETPGVTINDCIEELERVAGEDVELNSILRGAKLIEGKLSNTGIHAGGVIISDNDNVNDYIPLAYTIEKDIWAAQCDMIVAEEKGLLKMDVLGLSTLDVISMTINLIKKYRGIDIDINKIEFEPEVFKEIYSKGMTNSVFQVESAGMKDMMKNFKPTCFEDIILLVACYRPGPMQYLENIIEIKNGRKEATYLTPELEPITSMTYGATVYQEQVMRIFQSLAGYSLGGADLVRRAMSKKKESVLEKEREVFINGSAERKIDGCVKRGINAEIANQIFDQMIDFAKYAFNKSHATAYALVSYQTAWLKYHYPVEFICAMFNNTEQEKYSVLMEDCEYYGIKLLPPDINKSYYDFLVEDGNIRYGIRGIKEIGEANKDFIDSICDMRKCGAYSSVEDFLLRTMKVDTDEEGNENITFISKKMMEIFSNTGLFDSLGYNDRKKLVECAIEVKDKSSKQLSIMIKAMSIEKGNKDIAYNIEQELKYLDAILSFDPLGAYKDDRKYKCTPLNEIEEESNCSILGYVVNFIEKKDKYNNPIFVLEVKGNTGKIFVHSNKFMYKQFESKDLLNKVVKCTGNIKYGRMFANAISYPNPETFEYFIDLTTQEATNVISKMLNERSGEEDINVKIHCWWVVKNGKLTKIDRPKVAERNFTMDELKELGKLGYIIKKWDAKV